VLLPSQGLSQLGQPAALLGALAAQIGGGLAINSSPGCQCRQDMLERFAGLMIQYRPNYRVACYAVRVFVSAAMLLSIFSAVVKAGDIATHQV